MEPHLQGFHDYIVSKAARNPAFAASLLDNLIRQQDAVTQCEDNNNNVGDSHLARNVGEVEDGPHLNTPDPAKCTGTSAWPSTLGKLPTELLHMVLTFLPSLSNEPTTLDVSTIADAQPSFTFLFRTGNADVAVFRRYKDKSWDHPIYVPVDLRSVTMLRQTSKHIRDEVDSFIRLHSILSIHVDTLRWYVHLTSNACFQRC